MVKPYSVSKWKTYSDGFKLNAYKGMSFSQKCVKGCTTVVQLQSLWISLSWTNHIIDYSTVCWRKFIFLSFPTSWGKSVFPNLDTIFHDYIELRNRNLLRNLKSNSIEYMNYFRESLLTLYFCVTKLGDAICYHIKKWKEELILKWKERKP